MMKVNLVFLTLWSVSDAAYMSRMNSLTRVRTPSVFRPGPGMMLQRPMFPMRQMTSASYKTPYLVSYRNKPYRYAVKKVVTSSPNRNVFASPWRSTTRLPPTLPTAAFDFVRSAAPPIVSADGAIHTIPAPNLSLSEKPIVVVDSSENTDSQSLRPMYEVTEKYAEQPTYQVNAKIEQPVGFSKPPPISQSELLNRNNAAWQIAPDYGFQSVISQPSFVPQQFPLQGLINGIPVQNNFINRGPEGIIIPTNSMFQTDPLFLQKLQTQLVQQFPTIEFIPFKSDLQNKPIIPQQTQLKPQTQPQPYQQPQQNPQLQPHPQTQPQNLQLLQNEIQRVPDNYIAEESQKSVVLSRPPDTSYMSLKPQAFSMANQTERPAETTTETKLPQNITIQLISTETQAPTTTLKYVIATSVDEEKTTPIYYAQVGQSIDNDIANSFFTAINDVRAAAAIAQVEKPDDVYEVPKETTTSTSSTTTPMPPKLNLTEPKVVQQTSDKFFKNQSIIDIKNLMGSPFEKPAESVNVAYTLLRADEKQPKFDKDGSVFAGQLVEASVSEDQDFIKEKASLARRPPLRLVAVTEKKMTETTPRVTVVKAKIPPKSKLTFDDKTGEPVLRIYASYIDNQAQKDLTTAKLSSMKQPKDSFIKKQDSFDPWKAATVKSIESTLSDMNQVTQFGLKIKARSDDYEPLFDEYDE